MSTQAARSILFTHTSPQQGFRLLELPPDLAEQLSSKNPPTLELKSPSSSLSPVTTDPEAREYVNLCTATQTYRIRQVQSSNSLLVMRPSDGGAQRGDISIVGGDQDELNLVETMTSVSKCGSTLELHTPAGGFSALPSLERRLRVYDVVSSERESESEGHADEDLDPIERQEVLSRVLADVPVSRAQCEQGWIELCAFVLPRGTEDDLSSWCWRPSSRVKVDVWRRVVEGSVLQGIDLGKQFLVSDLWRSVLDEGGEEPFPQPLFEAVVRRVCESGVERDQVLAGTKMKWASIDKTSCARWVGETCLEAMAPTTTSAMARDDFLKTWRNHLPEPWQDEVKLSKLTENSYKHPEPTTICFVNETDRQKAKKNVSTDASAATAAKKTRNWHELFKNQKRQKQ
ncbi:sister chromatid cohesion protein Dcc1 [Aspergillus steynii IBT 23096]|uniref:Sister chromatid cohesion protein Dcc1 n=1 Tax=Aspergillus steynii IBT 23096 TaxID=1392250 RepID=A0A2I2GDY7_9EURO|nr:sister chromatid cohesion protein Dcc1 [Aspergillus steynii IBT 23096]PLB51108.1 sister chromatid cohesion protein Dcc1 [Aspergillus steynii IBT 23096]